MLTQAGGTEGFYLFNSSDLANWNGPQMIFKQSERPNNVTSHLYAMDYAQFGNDILFYFDYRFGNENQSKIGVAKVNGDLYGKYDVLSYDLTPNVKVYIPGFYVSDGIDGKRYIVFSMSSSS